MIHLIKHRRFLVKCTVHLNLDQLFQIDFFQFKLNIFYLYSENYQQQKT